MYQLYSLIILLLAVHATIEDEVVLRPIIDGFIKSSLYQQYLRKQMIPRSDGKIHERETAITNRLIGRLCVNFKKKEQGEPLEDVLIIEYFRKCSGCQRVTVI